jgi:hypothetical protein
VSNILADDATGDVLGDGEKELRMRWPLRRKGDSRPSRMLYVESTGIEVLVEERKGFALAAAEGLA